MAPSRVFQPINNVELRPQNGYNIVASATADFSGGDVLVGFSATGWATAAATPLSVELWFDGQPTGGRIRMEADVAESHLALGHGWVWIGRVPAGPHRLDLVAGMQTTTDQNDRASVTVWEMGDGCAVRFARNAGCPMGTGQTLMTQQFVGGRKQFLISAGMSGRDPRPPGVTGGTAAVDGKSVGALEVFENDSARRACVPTDIVVSAEPGGSHVAVLAASPGTYTDSADTAQLAVVDWVNPDSAPDVLKLEPPLQNATANTQPGDGGTIASTTFQSSGGPLLIKVSASVWTRVTGGMSLWVGVLLDSSPRGKGYTGIYANQAMTHMSTFTNDLVVTDVPAGTHTLELIAERSVVTDGNDRVSVLVLEFPRV